MRLPMDTSEGLIATIGTVDANIGGRVLMVSERFLAQEISTGVVVFCGGGVLQSTANAAQAEHVLLHLIDEGIIEVKGGSLLIVPGTVMPRARMAV